MNKGKEGEMKTNIIRVIIWMEERKENERRFEMLRSKSEREEVRLEEEQRAQKRD